MVELFQNKIWQRSGEGEFSSQKIIIQLIAGSKLKRRWQKLQRKGNIEI